LHPESLETENPMNDQDETEERRFLERVIRYQDGTLDPKEMLHLNDEMIADGTKRQIFAEVQIRSMLLHDQFRREAYQIAPKRKTPNWFVAVFVRPGLAAAAGIMFGMCCTSLMFAYVPWSAIIRAKPLPLKNPGFEETVEIPAAGVPTAAGFWSGDFSRVVGPDNGIVPLQGDRMLRFLRADNEHSLAAEPSFVGEATQILDLRPWRSELAGGHAVIEISAAFNCIPSASGEDFEFAVKAATFKGDPSDAARQWRNLEETSVSRAVRYVWADSNRSSWQRGSVAVAAPEDSDYLVFQCVVARKRPIAIDSAVVFRGHYVDDVEVHLHRPPLVAGR